jgi:dipeptidyl aminopeptidase/acylaminoacyl peptidase
MTESQVIPSDISTAIPCGAWPSPLTPALTAVGAVGLSFASAAGGRLYWIEGRPAEKGRSVWMCRLPNGEVREVLDALSVPVDVRSSVHEYGGNAYAALGERLAHSESADQRLRVHAADGTTHTLTPAGCRYADLSPAHDGHSLVAVREDHRGSGEATNAVVRLDVDQPADEGQLLFEHSDFVAWPRVSIDGKRLTWVTWEHPNMPWDSAQLWVGDLTAAGLSNPRVIAGGPGESVLEPQWAADGSLYFLSDRSGWSNLYRWHADVVTSVLALDAELGGPTWQLGTRSYALTTDGRALLRVNRGSVDSLLLLTLSSGAQRWLDLPFVAFGSVGLLDDDTAFAIASSVDQLPMLVTLHLSSGEYRAVRRAGEAVIAPAWVSRPQAIEFPTKPGPDGSSRSAQAWFYPPTNPANQPLPGEKPPLLVMLHGGPTSHAGPAFKSAVQFWTTRGFAVVDVNYGGSTGFGRAYRERLRGQWGVVDLQDAVAAVDYLAGQGWVDGQRVAIRGGSAGGFTVLSALAFTDRFAVGINYYGVADLETLATDTHKFESRYLDGLIAPLPEGRALYRARSPAHHMTQCRAALITFQGSADRAVPPQQSRDIVEAAKVAGCAVTYLEFEGEGHGFRQGANIVRALEHELVFLGRVFGYQPAEDLAPIEISNAEALNR